MTERGTPAEFARWVEPHLVVLARYAGRQVAPSDRDDVVQEALIRAWQRWSTYDERRGTPVAWLIGILADRCRRHRIRGPSAVVELVEHEAPSAMPDIDLERALDRLSRPTARRGRPPLLRGPRRGDRRRGDGLRARHRQGHPAPGSGPPT